ncbi:MAG: ATPase, T2SS/T4P/T4SS family [Pseudomonadota bacterium]
MENERDTGNLIITLASGRPGLGKSSIALNLAMTLIQKEKKVCLLDANLQSPKIAAMLGLPSSPTLTDFLEGRCGLEEVLQRGPDNLRIVSGGWALEKFPEPDGGAGEDPAAELGRALRAHDVVVVDAPPGVTEESLNLLTVAEVPVLVVTPEPKSLTDAFSVLRAFQRRTRNGPVNLIVNRVLSGNQAEIAANKFIAAAKKLLQVKIRPVAFLPEDSNFTERTTGKSSFFSYNPASPVSACLRGSLLFLEALGQEGVSDIVREGESCFPSDGDDRLGPPVFPRCDDTVRDALFASLDPGLEEAGDIVRLLIKENVLSKTQVQYAKKVQRKLETPKLLLEILKDLGYTREEEIKETLSKNRSSVRLGSLLFELGFISRDQLEKALQKQEKSSTPKCLGEVLVENKYISEYDLAQVLHLQLGFTYVEPRLGMLEDKFMNMASRDFFLTHKFLPLHLENGVLKIAMSDPLDCSSLEAVHKVFGPNVTPMLTMERFIVETLESYQPGDAPGRGVVEEAGPGPEELVKELIRETLERKASALHIEPLKSRVRVRLRQDGSLVVLREFPRDLFPRVVHHLKVLSGADPGERVRHQQGRINYASSKLQGDTTLLASFYITPFGEKITLRVQTQKTDFFSLADLGMGARLLDRFREDVLEVPGGVVLIAGPVESGRTTTLFAAVSYYNSDKVNIVTAEEPVEYVLEGVSQCSINPNIGLTLQATLQHILNQDPDIIVLGELRDKFSAAGAFQAALTGYKVLTTFHAEDPVGAIFRLENLDLERFLISSSLKGALAQRLLRRLCPYCREEYTPSPRDLRRLKFQTPDIKNHEFQVGTGCEYCGFTGYKGRVGVFELLIPNEQVREAVVGRKSFLEIRRAGLDSAGMVTLVEDGLAKAARGVTSLQEVIARLPVIEPPRPIEQVARLIGDI